MIIRKSATLLAAALLLLTSSAWQIDPTVENGKIVFESNCIRCHGHDGKLGKIGAKNLQVSKLSDEQLVKTISNGKWFMPRWKKTLTPDQIAAVAVYVKTLRK